MTMTDFLLLILVIGGALYIGYLFGRWTALGGRADGPAAANRSETADHSPSPLPGPREAELPRRAAPPPASAGGGSGAGGPGHGPAGAAPRRTAAPPPARAGLLDPGKDKS